MKLSIPLFLLACTCLRADEEASNVPIVRIDQWGHCYAKSVPSERYGSKGTTKIFSVQPGEDQLLHAFDWYANQIYLACNVVAPNGQIGASIVQFGPWARGTKAVAGDLALAFYYRGKLVRKYSTLDIAGSPGNVSQSISHYTVIQHINGYREQKSNSSTFEILTNAGRLIAFDPTTGAILPPNPAKGD